ncbi:hypothetical protein WS67_02685 [Burkholderia singularis]|uniref:Uncharacterized protein n=1 Tax=Burkholderia singularis TaxID=1503053 RepID=A0A103DV23_9BURK|nr:hypothetical protein [Burkholderia singularis]KVE23278.1 hypothetical protein WS67_02685 [Burkholderia singularis]
MIVMARNSFEVAPSAQPRHGFDARNRRIDLKNFEFAGDRSLAALFVNIERHEYEQPLLFAVRRPIDSSAGRAAPASGRDIRRASV